MQTKTIVLLGYPLQHSLSPYIHNTFFKELGLDYTYITLPIEPSRLAELGKDFLKILPFHGGNVTVPFKEKMFNYIDSVSSSASEIGAINTFYKEDGILYGDNTDLYGFIRSLQGLENNIKNKKVLLLGSGGSAKAVIHGLTNLFASNITVVSRSLEKAQSFISNKKHLNEITKFDYTTYQELNNLELNSFSAVINTTPVGMYEDISPIDHFVISALDKNTLVYDLIYNPQKTKLLLESEKLGLNILNGKRMLVYQAVKSFELWTKNILPNHLIERLIEDKYF